MQKKRKSRPNPYTLHKNLLKMDHKHKLKMQNYCTKVEDNIGGNINDLVFGNDFTIACISKNFTLF